MMNKFFDMISFKNTIILVSLISSLPAFSQSIKDVRINEIQIHNINGFRDEYGQANSWIELHNKGFGKVNVAGCTLKIRGAAYQIPKGDPATIIPTQGYLVFYADGAPAKGVFHTNFTLDDTEFIEFYDTDGKLIDRLPFNPADMPEGVSYGWFEGHDRKEKLMTLPATTPGSTNNTEEKISRAEVFRQADPTGIVLTITNIVVVAIALTLLFFIFKYMGKILMKTAVKKEKAKDSAITNDELAVIAIALLKFSETLQDSEEMALTINRVSKAYSPWNSKIYGLRQQINIQRFKNSKIQ